MISPDGRASLASRQRYLRRRRRFGDRTMVTAWVIVAAVASWGVIVAFAGLGH